MDLLRKRKSRLKSGDEFSFHDISVCLEHIESESFNMELPSLLSDLLDLANGKHLSKDAMTSVLSEFQYFGVEPDGYISPVMSSVVRNSIHRVGRKTVISNPFTDYVDLQIHNYLTSRFTINGLDPEEKDAIIHGVTRAEAVEILLKDHLTDDENQPGAFTIRLKNEQQTGQKKR